MSDHGKGKKRSKSYYRKCAAGGKKARKSQSISAGMKGFLVTCNKYEKETVREMYNLLNEYADVMYGPEVDNARKKLSEGSDSDSDEEDMEKAMAKETSAIKQITSAERRFQNTDTKCKNVIFIRTTVEDPCRLTHEIFKDIQEKQVQKARYALRILPVAAVSTPGPKEIEKTLRNVLAPHFETEFGVGIKYTAVCKIRNNNSVSKTTILPLLGKIIKEMNPRHQLCHDEPDLVIIVEIVQKACCFSVVEDYFTFKKYNLHEIVKRSTDETDDDTDNEARGSNKNDDVVGDDITDGSNMNIKEVADNTCIETCGNEKKGEGVDNGLNKKEDTENENSCNVQTIDTPAKHASVELNTESRDQVEISNLDDKEVSETSEKSVQIESEKNSTDQKVVTTD